MSNTVSIALINSNKHGVSGHSASCADVAKEAKRNREEPWVIEVHDDREAFLSYNSDFIAETGDESNCWPIHWHPCAVAAFGKVQADNMNRVKSILGPVVQVGGLDGNEAQPHPVQTVTVGPKWTTIRVDGKIIAEISNEHKAHIKAFLSY